MKALCSNCGKRAPKFKHKVRGTRMKYESRPNHDLCIQCMRDLQEPRRQEERELYKLARESASHDQTDSLL